MTIVPTISMEDIPVGCIILYQWVHTPYLSVQAPYQLYPTSDFQIMSVQVKKKVFHWDKSALALGALIEGLFYYVNSYDRVAWHYKKAEPSTNTNRLVDDLGIF